MERLWTTQVQQIRNVMTWSCLSDPWYMFDTVTFLGLLMSTLEPINSTYPFCSNLPTLEHIYIFTMQHSLWKRNAVIKPATYYFILGKLHGSWPYTHSSYSPTGSICLLLSEPWKLWGLCLSVIVRALRILSMSLVDIPSPYWRTVTFPCVLACRLMVCNSVLVHLESMFYTLCKLQCIK